MTDRSDSAPDSSSPPGRNARIVIIVLGVLIVLLLGAILLVLAQDDDDGDVAATGSTVTTPAAVTTTAPPPPATTIAPSTTDAPVPGPECSAATLFAAVDAAGGIAAADAQVADFECTPTSAGDLAGGYAWARLTAAGVDPLVVFFTAYAGDAAAGGATFSDWEVLTYGSDVACDDQIPAVACDLMPGAPRR